MWVSIAAWVVTVASTVIRLEANLSLPSRARDFGANLGGGNLYISSSKFYSVSGPPPEGPPSSMRLKLNRFGTNLYWRMWSVVDGSVVRSVGGSVFRITVVPLWYFAVPPTVAFFILHRRDRRLAHRLKHNLCTRCGYSRAGIAEGAKCPECGAGPANTRT